MSLSGTAIRSDDARGVWSIDSADLSLTWRRTDAGEIVAESLRAGNREWVSAEIPVFSMDGPDGPSIVFHHGDVSVVSDGTQLRLRGTLEPSGLTVSSVWTVYDGHSVIANELMLTNETDHDIDVGNLSTFHLRTETNRDKRLSVLAGGRWDEAMPPRGYRLQTYELHEFRRPRRFAAAEDGRSSGEYVPWLALTTPNGGLLAGLVWSGRWAMTAEHDGDWTTISLGIADVSHTLSPGEAMPLPGLVLGGYTGTLDDGANRWRAWVTEHWMPPVPENWPWVQYNHWYAYFGDIDESRLYEEAVHAAAAGCEVFVIDDGWFMGRRPDSYHEGWGNWREDPSKFPAGLHAFGDRIRSLGMTFGLWVEPERADSDGELVRDHPAFVATRDGVPIARLSDGTGGVHLCLGNPDVQDWMAADMIRVVHDYGVDWLKWDYNMGYGLGCNHPDHGHQAGDGHYAHTLGLYRVLEQLHAACPDLVIENCASGGHRVDMGTLRHTHTNWVSDYTYRAASCRQHVQGAGLMLPLNHLNTWVLHDRNTTEFRSRMGGAFGVSSFMRQWSDAERDALGKAIAEYRRLRPLLNGSRYLLSGPLHQDWDVWQFVDQSQDVFVILAFHDASRIEEVTVMPRGLQDNRTYRVQRSGDDKAREMDGASIVTEGLALRVAAGGSEIIWGTALPA
jgi:alpha-galactosidase